MKVSGQVIVCSEMSSFPSVMGFTLGWSGASNIPWTIY